MHRWWRGADHRHTKKSAKTRGTKRVEKMVKTCTALFTKGAAAAGTVCPSVRSLKRQARLRRQFEEHS